MKISSLKGIGEKTENLFHKVGVVTTDDLLHYYPRNYDVYEAPISIREAEEHKVCAVSGMVLKKPELKKVRNLQIVSTILKDEAGDQLKVTWFNMPFLRNSINAGSRFIFRGRISRKTGVVTMEQPEIFTLGGYEEKQNEYQPIYALTNGLSNKTIIKAVKSILDIKVTEQEFLPGSVRKQFELAEYNFSLKNIHFPKDKEFLYAARKRLVFDEFFLFILALRRFKDTKDFTVNRFKMQPSDHVEQLVQKLPYTLTNAQNKVWEDIKKDFSGEKIMSRLIQGDVGSGKTIIAVLALMQVAYHGYQGALMVPTEVLARQHYESVKGIFTEYGIDLKPVILTGSMTAKEKRETYQLIESGEADIIIGTHALIQEKVKYQNLALVITDEQHRFGVRQREALSNKGAEPHIIVMSATPIPRTLALIIYGDLDISIIDELPANRLPIKNCVVNTDYRPKAYQFILSEVRKGRQAYIICPMVEESEMSEAENVTDYTEMLRQSLPGDVTIEYLHGKMKPSLKNDIMQRFSENQIQILVSTTVIEVGINVPNATVMMIENAELFGLAGLHQLRGRVGRGKEQSYCILVSGTKKKETLERLEILNRSNDGFFIAGEDLRLRGPGDFFGLRQSGDIEFKIGDIFTDAKLLQSAADAAQQYLEDDLPCELDEKFRLEQKVNSYIEKVTGMVL